MYIGRIVAIAITSENRAAALYRVSSRSFPNREAVIGNGKVAVVPRAGFESDMSKNPYIAYNALRPARDGELMVVTNGSHTDQIAEKLDSGMSIRDSLTLSLLAMDYEHDQLDTPRVAGVISRDGVGYLGIVRKDAVMVRQMPLEAGKLFYIATYEHDRPCNGFNDPGFSALTAEECCNYIVDRGVFADFTNPVTAACAVAGEEGFRFAVRTV